MASSSALIRSPVKLGFTEFLQKRNYERYDRETQLANLQKSFAIKMQLEPQLTILRDQFIALRKTARNLVESQIISLEANRIATDNDENEKTDLKAQFDEQTQNFGVLMIDLNTTFERLKLFGSLQTAWEKLESLIYGATEIFGKVTSTPPQKATTRQQKQAFYRDILDKIETTKQAIEKLDGRLQDVFAAVPSDDLLNKKYEELEEEDLLASQTTKPVSTAAEKEAVRDLLKKISETENLRDGAIAGVDYSAQKAKKFENLVIAIQNKSEADVTRLVKDVPVAKYVASYKELLSDGQTIQRQGISLMGVAIRTSTVAILKILLGKGTPQFVNFIDRQQKTPLMHAVEVENIEAVTYLLTLANIKTDITTPAGNALFLTITNKTPAILRLLLEKAKASDLLLGNITSLDLAFVERDKDIEFITTLIEYDAINRLDLAPWFVSRKYTIFLLAEQTRETYNLYVSREDFSRALFQDYGEKGQSIITNAIQNGADVNYRQGPKRLTPIMYVLEKRGVLTSYDFEVITLLLAAGADLTARDGTGRTALDIITKKYGVNSAEIQMFAKASDDSTVRNRAFAEIEPTAQDLFAVGIETDIPYQSLVEALRENETIAPFLQNVPDHKLVASFMKVRDTVQKVKERESSQDEGSKRRRVRQDSSPESSEREFIDDSDDSDKPEPEFTAVIGKPNRNEREADTMLDSAFMQINQYIENTELVAVKKIAVIIDGKPISLEMVIYNVRRNPTKGVLIGLLRFPKNYESAFSTATRGDFAVVQFNYIYKDAWPEPRVELALFYSKRQSTTGYLQTEGERQGLKGVASRTLCRLLLYALEKKLFQSPDFMTATATGDAPGKNPENLVDSVYDRLGFEVVEENTLADGTTSKKIEVQVWKLKRKCKNFIEDDADEANIEDESSKKNLVDEAEEREFIDDIESITDFVVSEIIGNESASARIYIPVKIGDKDVSLEMLIYNVPTPVAIVRFPKTYDSRFSTYTKKNLVLIRFTYGDKPGTYDLNTFNSRRQYPEGKLQTKEEDAALKGIGSRSLCILLKYARAEKIFKDRDTIVALASGKARGQNYNDLIPKVYEKLGFEKIDYSSDEESDDAAILPNIKVQFKTLRKKCAEFIGDDGDTDLDENAEDDDADNIDEDDDAENIDEDDDAEGVDEDDDDETANEDDDAEGVDEDDDEKNSKEDDEANSK